jgi:hypothetical protein
MPDVWVSVPLNQEIQDVPLTGYDPVFFSPEGTKVVFEFTDETFLKVYSALRNGAKVTYPDEWLQVLWYFQQNVEFPVSLCDEVAAAILTCEDVQLAIATLIATNEPVQDAIETLVTTSPAIYTYITNVFSRLTPETIEGKLAPGNCDDSVMAGRAIAIVERLDTNNIDALEILEVGTNDEERLAQILSAFPGFGLLPLDELLDFAQDVLEDFAENYGAASTVERKDAFARLIWCKMQETEDCSITWQQLFDLVLEQVPATLFDILVTITDVIQFVGDGDFGNDDLLFYGMMMLNLATITASSSFNGLTAPLLSAITRDALPSSAWEDWDECGAEPPDPNCADLTEDPEDWQVSLGRSEWIDGTGWTTKTTVDGTFFRVTRPSETVSRFIAEVRLYFNIPVTNMRVSIAGVNCDFAGPIDELVMNETNFPALFPFTSGAPNTITVMKNVSLNFSDQPTMAMIQSCIVPV